MTAILKAMALAAATYCNGSCKSECSIVCPVCHKMCKDVTPKDWLNAYFSGSIHLDLHKQKEDQERPKFKCVICKLVDKDGHEICSGGCFAHDEHVRDDTPFEEFEKEAHKSLLSNFREVMTAKLPSYATATQGELSRIMNAMIAMAGYKIEWFSCGQEDK